MLNVISAQIKADELLKEFIIQSIEQIISAYIFVCLSLQHRLDIHSLDAQLS